jgi:ELWxxDGT repeat protein
MLRQTVLFEGFDVSGNAGLWETNGTAAGTYELTGISGANASGLFQGVNYPSFTVFNGEVLFEGLDASGQLGLWLTNGTASGTHELTGISGTHSGGIFVSSATPDFTVFNSELLFAGVDASGNIGLWVSNGTVPGTYELTGISGASSIFADNPDFTVFDGQVLFGGFGTSHPVAGLWVTNGTAAGTYELTGSISGADPWGVSPQDMTVFNGEVLFNGLDASFHNGLWVTNGTSAGTYELTGISGAAVASNGLEPQFLTVFNGEVLFAGFEASGGAGLWVTNGTAAGTHVLMDFGELPFFLTAFNNEVLFAGSMGLWVTNGTSAGTYELAGISGAYTGSGGFFPEELTVFNGEVVFEGDYASGQRGLWITNGTAAGTHQLTGINGASSNVGGLNPLYLTSSTLITPPPNDFLANNTSDALFRDTTSGDTWFEAISNGTFASWNQIGGFQHLL